MSSEAGEFEGRELPLAARGEQLRVVVEWVEIGVG